MMIVTQYTTYVLLLAITTWMDFDMNEDVKEISESKWDTLNQMFVINQLVNQAYGEIYEHKADPWKVYRKKCKMMCQIEKSLNVYLLYQELYDKLERTENQIIARHLSQ